MPQNKFPIVQGPNVQIHKGKEGMVDCLGKGLDHTFLSPDTSRIQICPDCKRKARLRVRMW